ncbi:hypothetical protein [Nostoc sp. UHCC 0870]|nr:hypothetical protein [Nostoc sp. UHCC 0870]UKO99413.1 hypothetical protein L6494_06800 [Nostoc sp. UHCC 0870]
MLSRLPNYLMKKSRLAAKASVLDMTSRLVACGGQQTETFPMVLLQL